MSAAGGHPHLHDEAASHHTIGKTFGVTDALWTRPEKTGQMAERSSPPSMETRKGKVLRGLRLEL